MTGPDRDQPKVTGRVNVAVLEGENAGKMLCYLTTLSLVVDKGRLRLVGIKAKEVPYERPEPEEPEPPEPPPRNPRDNDDGI